MRLRCTKTDGGYLIHYPTNVRLRLFEATGEKPRSGMIMHGEVCTTDTRIASHITGDMQYAAMELARWEQEPDTDWLAESAEAQEG